MREPHTPRAAAEAAEDGPRLPPGGGDRFAGYWVPALAFASGHVLGFRRASSSSIGPRFTSVWHRDPGGRWTCCMDAQPDHGCPRYFGSAFSRVVRGEIGLAWDDDDRVTLSVPAARIEWSLRLEPTLATRAVNAGLRILPDALLNRPAVRDRAAPIIGRALDAEPFSLSGTTPMGHAAALELRRVWDIAASVAVVDGRDVGPMMQSGEPPSIGGIEFPRRGVFLFGGNVYAPPR